MPTWKVKRGEDYAVEGTVTFSTMAGGPLSPMNLTGATMTWHMGSVLAVPMMLRSGSSFTYTVATSGVYQFALTPGDTESLAATSYYFDIWIKTPATKEYCLTVGTLELQDVVGTI